MMGYNVEVWKGGEMLESIGNVNMSEHEAETVAFHERDAHIAEGTVDHLEPITYDGRIGFVGFSEGGLLFKILVQKGAG
jgi:isocitrate lyase